jgi:purine-binding chemotaxis protein CheW
MSATLESPRPITTKPAGIVLGGKYLTFALGYEEYGLAILKVREIIGCMEITAVPRTPDYVKGVINLRGQVIAVIDLRRKFGMEAAASTEQTCIIVVEIEHEQGKCSTGVIVDRVSEVLNIPNENIEEPPSFGVSGDFILGMGKIGKTVKILLDIDRILNSTEVAQIQAVRQSLDAAS